MKPSMRPIPFAAARRRDSREPVDHPRIVLPPLAGSGCRLKRRPPSQASVAGWTASGRTWSFTEHVAVGRTPRSRNPGPYRQKWRPGSGFRPLVDPTADVGGQHAAFRSPRHGAGLRRRMAGGPGRRRNHGRGNRVVENARCRAPGSSSLPSGRVNLTSLEFGVMQYLQDHPGKAVSRYDLMEAVWGHRNDTASNVVDVVVRSLRRKLGGESSAIETVRGTGVPISDVRPRRHQPELSAHGRR